MDESGVVSAADRLSGASPREAHDFLAANPWLLEGGVDDLIAALLATARRQGNGPFAERLERVRRMLQRCREYGADRVLVRDLLDRLGSLSPTELVDTMQMVPAEELQAELRRRIDGSIDIGDVLAWNHWVTVSIALDRAEGSDPLQVATSVAGAASDELEAAAAQWAREFLGQHDPDAQRAMLRDSELPLAPPLFGQVRLQFGVEHLLAVRERDALEVIHLRQSLAMAQVAANADEDPVLVEDVLSGRQRVFVEGIVL